MDKDAETEVLKLLEELREGQKQQLEKQSEALDRVVRVSSLAVGCD